jgi:hypothetical protein
MRSYVGYMGPFSGEALAGKLDFAPGAIPPADSFGEKSRITASTTVCKE